MSASETATTRRRAVGAAIVAGVLTGLAVTPGLIAHWCWWKSQLRPFSVLDPAKAERLWRRYWDNFEDWPYYSRECVAAFCVLAVVANASTVFAILSSDSHLRFRSLMAGFRTAILFLIVSNIVALLVQEIQQSVNSRNRISFAVFADVTSGRAGAIPGQTLTLWLPLIAGAAMGVIRSRRSHQTLQRDSTLQAEPE